MKYMQVLTALAVLVALTGPVWASGTGYNSSNYNSQGGALTNIGGEIDIKSGGILDVKSGGYFKIAGTSVTSDAGELNLLDGVTATTAELNYVDLATLGTGAASKAIVLDGSGDYTAPATLNFTVPSGGDITLQSGSSFNAAGTFKIGGTTVTSSAAELNILTGVLATAAEINRAADVSTRVVALNVSTVITELAHDAKILLLGGAGSARTMTLPAATGSGATFCFTVGAVNTSNYVIQVANGTDIIQGSLVLNGDNASNALTGFETTGTSDTITMNGTTTGGASVGDRLCLQDVASGKFSVWGTITESGSEATPFSASVP